MIKHSLALLLLINLTACNSVNPVWDTFKAATGLGEGKSAALKPGVEYLKVNVNGHQAMMALGYRTFPNPAGSASNPTNGEQLVKNAKLYSPDQYVHEFWYSGQKEMMELVEGRVVSVMGMTAEWRQTNSISPSWDSVGSSSMPTAWIRNRDLMPGYRFGFKDQILTKLIESPKAFKEVPTNATWYEDSITSKDREGNAWSYKQLFARMGGKIIYSEQCIAEDLCLTMKYIGMISKQ